MSQRPHMLAMLLRHCAEPVTVLELAYKMRTSEASADSLLRKYSRRGYLVKVGTRPGKTKPRNVYMAAP